MQPVFFCVKIEYDHNHDQSQLSATATEGPVFSGPVRSSCGLFPVLVTGPANTSDFAQLPPAIGQEHAALYRRTVGRNSVHVRDQEAAVGKALWHQVTTVVILRQNMRQRQQSLQDAQLLQALTNMCYKACTAEDVAFLRARISSQSPGRPSLISNEFRNVSIITALNVHEDEINRLGTLQFSQETSQELVDFYSEDTFSSANTDGSSRRSHPKRPRTETKATVLSESVQNVVWTSLFN